MLQPVDLFRSDEGVRVRWNAEPGPDVVGPRGSLVDTLNAILERRLLRTVQEGLSERPDRGRLAADLGDVADFVEGRTHDERLDSLLGGLVLVDWSRVEGSPLAVRVRPRRPRPSAFYALLKACHPEAGHPGEPVPVLPTIHRWARDGRGAVAAREAVRRLRGSGLACALGQLHAAGETVQRAAAALLFPLSPFDHGLLLRTITRPHEEPDASAATTKREGDAR
jgi:CRISPR-associated protein Csx17